MLKIGLMILVAFAIIMQIRITKMVYDKQEILDANPLSYGASKYGIVDCTCYISESKQVWFNQSEVIVRVKQKSIYDYSSNTNKMNLEELNIS